jgi:hypothetical protein
LARPYFSGSYGFPQAALAKAAVREVEASGYALGEDIFPGFSLFSHLGGARDVGGRWPAGIGGQGSPNQADNVRLEGGRVGSDFGFVPPQEALGEAADVLLEGGGAGIWGLKLYIKKLSRISHFRKSPLNINHLKRSNEQKQRT